LEVAPRPWQGLWPAETGHAHGLFDTGQKKDWSRIQACLCREEEKVDERFGAGASRPPTADG
jgi:hypothetical protein